MAHVYFHYRSGPRVFLDQRGADVDDLTDGYEHAVRDVRSLIAIRTSEDWRNWVLRVSDDQGGEIFTVQFSSVIGKPH